MTSPKSPAPLCFLDTETTGLHPDARAWEFAGIRVTPGEPDREFHCFIDIPLDDADPNALKIGGFYDRHPTYAPPPATITAHDDRWMSLTRGALGALSTRTAAKEIEHITRGAILVGSNPDYDARVLDRLLRSEGLIPAWHYRTLDVITLAAGRLARSTKPEHRALIDTHPWKSDRLAEALGVTVTQQDRHTALGDTIWTRRVYEAATHR